MEPSKIQLTVTFYKNDESHNGYGLQNRDIMESSSEMIVHTKVFRKWVAIEENDMMASFTRPESVFLWFICFTVICTTAFRTFSWNHHWRHMGGMNLGQYLRTIYGLMYMLKYQLKSFLLNTVTYLTSELEALYTMFFLLFSFNIQFYLFLYCNFHNSVTPRRISNKIT